MTMARAVVFPGQGAQYVGMGLELAQHYPVARALLDQADAVLGFALSDYILNGPEGDLCRTDISQPAILVVSMMALEVARSALGQLPFSAAAGLSLGEYSALVAAQAIDFPTALRLVRLRGEAMQAAADAQPSGMVALIGANETTAESICTAAAVAPDGTTEIIQVANLNSTGQVVIAGTAAACARAVALARGFGIRRALALQVAGAFHSPLMQPAMTRLQAALADVQFRDPIVPVYANVHGGPVTKGSEIPDLLARQLVKPVRWADGVVNMEKAGITEFWEFGPGATVSGLIARITPSVTCRHVEKPEDVLALVAAERAGGGPLLPPH
jgi:[acyl-carrier-protein] S-malonyltransferase